MDAAREHIKPIAEEFGKKPVADACELLVEIVPGKEPVARLKSHIKGIAFQILGPEVSLASSEPESKSRSAPARKKKQKRAEAPDLPLAHDNTATPQPHSPIMEQYREAKEKHPNMILLIFKLIEPKPHFHESIPPTLVPLSFTRKRLPAWTSCGGRLMQAESRWGRWSAVALD